MDCRGGAAQLTDNDAVCDEPVDFLHLFDRNVAAASAKVACLWLDDNGDAVRAVTYAQLQTTSLDISHALLARWGAKPGDRVVLVYPPGLEFLEAFLACLRSGLIAVPVYPPHSSSLSVDIPKLRRVVKDAGASLILTSHAYSRLRKLTRLVQRWPGKKWRSTDNIKRSPVVGAAKGLTEHRVGGFAFLQYTSGSTGEPKGVVISWQGIAHNTFAIRRTLRVRARSRIFSWLPQYHDMGLIVAYMSTLSAGAGGVYMSPAGFIKQPNLWLALLTKYQSTHTFSPNFGLELCVRKFDSGRFADGSLDLSSLQCLLNGAEPIREDTIDRFNNAFATYGWKPSSLSTSYGLAEHTVGVSAWGTKTTSRCSTERTCKVLHSSGDLTAFDDVDESLRIVVSIVDPQRLCEVEDGEEGEIWVHSPSVASGYWNKPELTQQTFEAEIAKTMYERSRSTWSFLRTGDLGFTVDGQLFVTGRIKDIIIIGGRNYYPQDIEKTVELAVPKDIRPGCVAAFAHYPASKSAQSTIEESVAIVAEVKSPQLLATKLDSVASAVARAVCVAHGIAPSLVALIAPKESNMESGGPRPVLSLERVVLAAAGVALETTVRANDTLGSLGLSSPAAAEIAEIITERTGQPVALERISQVKISDLRKLDSSSAITPSKTSSASSCLLSAGDVSARGHRWKTLHSMDSVQTCEQHGLACILSIGTANPDQAILREAASKYYSDLTGCQDEDVLEKYKGSEADADDEIDGGCFTTDPRFRCPISQSTSEWGGEASGITHLVVATVSGVHIPGTDLKLAKLLGLRPSINRVMLHMLGCYAGVTGLRISKDLAENSAGARVLFVCCELNSLTFQSPDDGMPDNIVTAALFGDGAAAVVIGVGAKAGEAKPMFEIKQTSELLLPETEDCIKGELNDSGLLVHLSKEVPLLLGQPTRDHCAELLEGVGVHFDDIFWAVHPGGPAILDVIERRCQLKGDQLRPSRAVLDEFGNMSSASVLFVLDKIWQESRKVSGDRSAQQQWGLALGFGPGITIEAALMRLL
eukprot:SM000397S15170  [mRNA]  locus=s397:43908:51260:- [translate_table: standard]